MRLVSKNESILQDLHFVSTRTLERTQLNTMDIIFKKQIWNNRTKDDYTSYVNQNEENVVKFNRRNEHFPVENEKNGKA